MRRNVELNGLGPKPAVTGEGPSHDADRAEALPQDDPGKVRVNEGDAWCVFSRICIPRVPTLFAAL